MPGCVTKPGATSGGFRDSVSVPSAGFPETEAKTPDAALLIAGLLTTKLTGGRTEGVTVVRPGPAVVSIGITKLCPNSGTL